MVAAVARVLFISKPLSPPWNDSGKNLPRDLARALTRHTAVVMTSRAGSTAWAASPRVVAERVYPEAGAFAPPLRQNLRVLRRLLVGKREALLHFFFAPNPRTSLAARWAARARRLPTVQTVASAPRRFTPAARLFFGDRVVVLSRWTERAALEAGVPAARLVRIPACVEPLPVATGDDRRAARRTLGLPAEAPVVLFPGDYEMGGGAMRTLRAAARTSDALVVFACRPKTAGAEGARQALAAEAERLGVASRVRLLGQTAAIHELLRAADVVALPSTDLYAKMDQPLVLLEAMSLGRAVVVARGTPAEELAEEDAARAIGGDEELTEALRHLLQGDAAAALGARAAVAVRERFAPRIVAEAYEALYDALLPPTRSR